MQQSKHSNTTLLQGRQHVAHFLGVESWPSPLTICFDYQKETRSNPNTFLQGLGDQKVPQCSVFLSSKLNIPVEFKKEIKILQLHRKLTTQQKWMRWGKIHWRIAPLMKPESARQTNKGLLVQKHMIDVHTITQTYRCFRLYGYINA